MLTITILICSNNGEETIGDCLKSIAEIDVLDRIEIEVVLVNSASTDNTSNIIKKFSLPFTKRIIRLNIIGQSNALNRGVMASKGSIILFTDDDCLVDKNWLKAYYSAAIENPDSGYFFGRISPIYEKEPPHWWDIVPRSLRGRDQGQSKKIFKVFEKESYPIGCNMCVRKEVFQSGIRFDERLGPNPNSRINLGADTKLGRDIFSRGYQAVYVNDSVVYHKIPKLRITWDYIHSRAIASGRSSIYYKTPYISFTNCILFLLQVTVQLIIYGIGYVITLIAKKESKKRLNLLCYAKAKGGLIESIKILTEMLKGKILHESK